VCKHPSYQVPYLPLALICLSPRICIHPAVVSARADKLVCCQDESCRCSWVELRPPVPLREPTGRWSRASSHYNRSITAALTTRLKSRNLPTLTYQIAALCNTANMPDVSVPTESDTGNGLMRHRSSAGSRSSLTRHPSTCHTRLYSPRRANHSCERTTNVPSQRWSLARRRVPYAIMEHRDLAAGRPGQRGHAHRLREGRVQPAPLLRKTQAE
jgi:hypothetical protein